MAQQALALGGAALGAWIGGPWGARIGFALGTAAGSLLFPEKSPKPQKSDTTVQSGSYGTPIAVLAGTDRTAGTLIWVKENKLQTKKVKTGGKGLGATSSGQATYEYFASFAVVIGKGPIDGIRKIWCDTKLEHDKSGARIEEVIANGGQFVTNLHAIDANLRIYLGTDDQLPDPAIQADVGADNCPAFRGLAYIVFDELPLADFANRIPNISVEYVKDGVLEYYNLDLSATAPAGTAADSSFPSTVFDAYQHYLWNLGPGGYVTKMDLSSGTTALQVHVESQEDSNGAAIAIGPGTLAADEPEFGNVYVPHGLSNFDTTLLYKFDANTLQYKSHIAAVASHFVGNWTYRSFLSGSSRWVFGLASVGHLYVVDANTFALACGALDTNADGGSWADMVDMSPDMEFWVTNSATSHVKRYSLTINPAGPLPWQLTLISDIDLSGTFGASGVNRIHYLVDENVVLIGADGRIAKLDPATETVTATMTGFGTDLVDGYEWQKGPVNGKLWSKLTGADGAFIETDIPSLTIMRSITPSTWTSSGGTKISVGYDKYSDALISFVASGGGIRMLFLPRLDPLDVDRADVITQYSAEVDVAASEINVTLVTDTIQGNTIRRQTTGRDAVEPILQTGFIDPVDVDRKVKFVPRGQAVTLTITEDDLGAEIGDRDSDRQKLIETIEQEIKLPERMLIRYVNREAQYDPGAQEAKRSRSAVNSRERITFDTSEVMADDTARQCVDKLLYSTWAERTRLRFSLMPKHGKLIPTDVVNVTRGAVSYEIRLDRVNIGPYLECEGVAQDTASYSSSVTGAPSAIPEEVLQLLSPTQLFLIDSNMLRDEDDDGEHYLALAPTVLDGLWPGAQIFKSEDAVTFAPSTSFSTAVDWGVAEGALADHHCTTTDRYNTLTVTMIRDEAGLASVTELAMLNGANAFLLQSGTDWELIQAADITSLGGGRYTLSTLLRGVRGTEQAASGHLAGDRIIVLDADTMNRLGVTAEIDQVRYYKAVTFGKAFDPTGAITFTNTARGRDCYAPAHVKGARDGALDLTITWVRRSRIGGELDWGDAITDVPLGEDSEAYVVEILNGSTVVRTISGLSSETTTYTAAQQASDFGSAQNSVAVKVYQVSADNGNGRAASATI